MALQEEIILSLGEGARSEIELREAQLSQAEAALSIANARVAELERELADAVRFHSDEYRNRVALTRERDEARERIAELEFEAKLSRESAEATYANRTEERRALLGRIDELEKELAGAKQLLGMFEAEARAKGLAVDVMLDAMNEETT